MGSTTAVRADKGEHGCCLRALCCFIRAGKPGSGTCTRRASTMSPSVAAPSSRM